jgi:hypothetical protein
MAEEAGVKYFQVNRHFPYRIGLVGSKKSNLAVK